MTDWRKVPCPECKRKGLHYAMHPHAYGWKDFGKVECRFCHKRFRVRAEGENATKEGTP